MRRICLNSLGLVFGPLVTALAICGLVAAGSGRATVDTGSEVGASGADDAAAEAAIARPDQCRLEPIHAGWAGIARLLRAVQGDVLQTSFRQMVERAHVQAYGLYRRTAPEDQMAAGRNLAVVKLELALIHRRNGRAGLARSVLIDTKRLLLEHEDANAACLATTSLRLGRTLVELRDFAAADRELATAERLFSELGRSEGQSVAWARLGRSTAQLGVGDLEQAGALARSAMIAFESEHPLLLEGTIAAQIQLSRIAVERLNYGIADQWLEDAVLLLAAHVEGEELFHGSAYYNLGEIALMRGHFTESLRHTEAALEIYDRFLPKTHVLLGRAHHRLGILSERLSDVTRSIDHFDRAIEIFRSFGSITDEGTSLVESVHVLSRLGRREEALRRAEKGVRIFSENKATFGQWDARAQVSLGIAHLRLGDLSRARRSLELAIRLFEDERGFCNENMPNALRELARLARIEGRPDLGRFYAVRALSVLETTAASEERIGEARRLLATFSGGAAPSGPVRGC